MTVHYQPTRRKTTTNGFECKTAPSVAKHPDFQRGEQFNGPINPLGNKLATLPKQTASDSWWALPHAQTREGFNELREQRQTAMAESKEARMVSVKFITGETV